MKSPNNQREVSRLTIQERTQVEYMALLLQKMPEKAREHLAFMLEKAAFLESATQSKTNKT